MADVWSLVVLANRWLLYTSMLMASGSAAFLILMAPPGKVACFTARVGRAAAAISFLTYVLAVGAGGADMLGGGADAILFATAWRLGVHTSLGYSAAIGVPAMALLVFGFCRENAAALLTGAAAAVVSFAVTGHAATAPPAWLMAPVVGLHLICAAFWAGALLPLYVAVRMLPSAESGALLVRFSRHAIYAVVGLVASGLAISQVQVVEPARLFTTDYGLRLITKVAMVAFTAGLAVLNKTVLTPRLLRADPQSDIAMGRTIVIEIVLQSLIIAAAVSLTLTAPPRALG